MRNYHDNFQSYKQNEIVLDDFNYDISTDFDNFWGNSSNATGVSIGSGSPAGLQKNTVTLQTTFSGAGNGFFTLTSGRRETIDVSRLTGVASGVPTRGKVRIGIQVGASEKSAIDAVSLKIGSSSSNYLTWSIVNPSTYNVIIESVVQWFEVDLDTLSATGTPDWTKLGYLQFTIHTTSGSRNVTVMGLRMVEEAGVSGGHLSEDTNLSTYGKSMIMTTKRLGVLGLIQMNNASSDSTTKIITEVLDKSTGQRREFGNVFTAEVRYTGAGGSGPVNNAGIAFHISTRTKGGQNCYVVRKTSSSDEYKFDKIVNGTVTTLATGSAMSVSAFQDIGFIRVENNDGDFIISVSSDGVNYQTVIHKSDSTFTSGGVGLYSDATNDLSANSNSNAIFLSLRCYVEANYVEFGDFSFDERSIIQIQNVQAYSAPEFQSNVLDISNSSTRKFVSRYAKSKYITVTAQVLAQDRDDFILMLDEIKGKLQTSGRLIVGNGKGSDGIYQVSEYRDSIAINLDDILKNEYFEQQVIEFTVMFEVPEGVANSEGLRYLSMTAISGYTGFTWNFKGTAGPKPLMTLTLQDVDAASGDDLDTIMLINFTTGRSLQLANNGPFVDGQVIVFDFEEKEVRLNGQPVQFSGSLSDDFFEPGENAMALHGFRQDDIAVSNEPPTNGGFISGPHGGVTGTVDVAQSFTVPTSTTYPFLDIFVSGPGREFLSNIGLQFRVYGDDTGAPDLFDQRASGKVNVPNSDFQFVRIYLGASVSLTATELCWLMFFSDGGLVGNRVVGHRFKGTNENNYTGGNLVKSNNNFSSFEAVANYDLCFRLYKASCDPTGVVLLLDARYQERSI